MVRHKADYHNNEADQGKISNVFLVPVQPKSHTIYGRHTSASCAPDYIMGKIWFNQAMLRHVNSRNLFIFKYYFYIKEVFI